MSSTPPDQRQERRTILAIALPLMAAYLAEMGMMITDMIIVGRLGGKELAAVGLTADWFYVLLLIGMGVVAIVGVLVAQNFGANNPDGVRNAAEQGLIAATICSIPVIFAVYFLGPALQYARQDPEVIELITDYSRPLALSVFPALWFVALRNFVTALERAAGIMTITVLALIANLGINYTLVFGHLGFPALGVVGAAYGTAIVNWLMFAWLAIHVTRSPHFARFRPRIIPRSINWNTCREIFRLGLPISASQILAAGMFTIAAVVVGTLGAEILAAQMIIYSVIYTCLSASLAFGDAVRVRVAYGIGKGSVAASRQSAKIAVTLATATVFVATLVLWLLPETIVSVFLDTNDPENAGVLALAVGLAIYAGLFQLIDGVLIIYANGLRGLRDTKSPFWISVIGYWLVGVGLGSWFALATDYGAIGMWWGLTIGGAVGLILMALRLKQRFDEADARL